MKLLLIEDNDELCENLSDDSHCLLEKLSKGSTAKFETDKNFENDLQPLIVIARMGISDNRKYGGNKSERKLELKPNASDITNKSKIYVIGGKGDLIAAVTTTGDGTKAVMGGIIDVDTFLSAVDLIAGKAGEIIDNREIMQNLENDFHVFKDAYDAIRGVLRFSR